MPPKDLDLTHTNKEKQNAIKQTKRSITHTLYVNGY